MPQGKMTPPEKLYTALNDGWFDNEDEQKKTHYHLGFEYATKSLANKLETLGIHSGWNILDLCCGWGTPTRYLAERFGCRITGIDLTQANIDAAKKFSNGTQVDLLITFMRRDATNIPLESEEVDLVWSQDGFCHIPDRLLVLSECYRVLRPGGYLVFTDWLQGDFITEHGLAAFSRAWTLINIEKPTTYPILLTNQGFELISQEEVGKEYAVANEKHTLDQNQVTYLQQMANFQGDIGSQLLEKIGYDLYLHQLERIKLELYFAMGKMALGRFICQKPMS